jgi:FixJ family two-component response regulator
MSELRKIVIAVVDDDPGVLESLEDLLESAGHSVLPFASGLALLEHADFPSVDCLIADIGMPVLDGFELQRIARARRPDLPVILITGRHEIADQRRAAALGNHGFFCKPFDGQSLLAAVGRAVSSADEGGCL